MRLTFEAYDEMKSLSEMEDSPFQTNKHNDRQIKQLAKMMKAHGVSHPISLTHGTKRIAFGHGRRDAAILNGWDKYPVIYQTFKDEDEEKVKVTSDNAIALQAELDIGKVSELNLDLGPDFDLELWGLKDFEIDLSDKFHADEDDVPDQVEAKTKLGDIYQLGSHRLMCGDSTSIDAVEKLMDGEKADMVFTDPPYGVDVVKGGKVGGDSLAKTGTYSNIIGDETTDTARDVYSLVAALAVPVICLWGGNYYSAFCPPTAGWLVWDKRAGMNSNNFADCELAWTNQERPARLYSQMWSGMIKQGESGKRVHPTQKPTALAEWAFSVLDPDSKAVLDLFGGSGSTLIACEKTNRKCFMMELDPHYCDVIVARWEKFTGKKAELIHG